MLAWSFYFVKYSFRGFKLLTFILLYDIIEIEYEYRWQFRYKPIFVARLPPIW